jgi:uncharacterized protein GlcG (DUF336 family)
MTQSKFQQYLLSAALAMVFTPLVHAAEPAPSVPAPAATNTPTPAAPPARGPSLALALEAAQTAVATCSANGYKAAVSVVDSAGVVKAVLAADGASARGVASSQAKAFTSITYKTSSDAVAKKAEADPELLAKLNADPKHRARAGALPLFVGNELIGAIGVGGAPGGDKDEACALAGVNKVKDRLI